MWRIRLVVMYTPLMKRLQIYIDEELDDALAVRARRAHTSKAALIREAVRRSIGEPEAAVDPFREWIGGSDADAASIDEVVYGS
jgi:Arc/MetJ family transcription regulator